MTKEIPIQKLVLNVIAMAALTAYVIPYESMTSTIAQKEKEKGKVEDEG